MRVLSAFAAPNRQKRCARFFIARVDEIERGENMKILAAVLIVFDAAILGFVFLQIAELASFWE